MNPRVFIDREHEEFYEKMKEYYSVDCCRQALFYLLGASQVTREHIREIYAFKEKSIFLSCVNASFQTRTTKRICRLAFCLYGNGAPTAEILENDEECIEELKMYTPDNLFDCELKEVMIEAMRLRFC